MDAARKRATLTTIGVLVGFCGLPILLVWAVLRYGVQSVEFITEGREAQLCQSRLAKVAAGLNLYAADNDDTYPPGVRWVDASWSYAAKEDPAVESESVFRCPAVSKLRTGDYGYALNSDLAGKRRDRILDPKTAPLAFDTSLTNRNASASLDTAPMPPRHRGGRSNYAATVDGRAVVLP